MTTDRTPEERRDWLTDLAGKYRDRAATTHCPGCADYWTGQAESAERDAREIRSTP